MAIIWILQAKNYFTTGSGVSTASAWNKVTVDLPDAQDIVDASLIVNPKQDFTFNISEESATWWCLGSHAQDQPSGPLYCPSSANQQKYAWLFNYTRGCQSRGCATEYPDTDGYPYGYWTRDLVSGASNAWNVPRNGALGNDTVSDASYGGVRPVITLSKSNLSN